MDGCGATAGRRNLASRWMVLWNQNLQHGCSNTARSRSKKGPVSTAIYVKICKGWILRIQPFFMQLPKGNFYPSAGFINPEERFKMNWHLGLLAGRKERYMKITKLLSHAL